MDQGLTLVAVRALPRWQQMSERLIREITAGRLAHGARLPPEREMAAGLGLAVGTLRKALADLAAKGLLDRRQGSGNYVVRRGGAAGAPGAYAMFRLEFPGDGGLPTAELIAWGAGSSPQAPLPSAGRPTRTASAACAGSMVWRWRLRRSGLTFPGPRSRPRGCRRRSTSRSAPCWA